VRGRLSGEIWMAFLVDWEEKVDRERQKG